MSSPFLRGSDPFYLIAEASGNHAQDLRRAHALVDAAADSGAHAVKFQTFRAEEIAADNIPILRGYDATHDEWLDGLKTKTMRELFQLGGLPRAWHRELRNHATDRGIDFLSTPFSVDAARFLVEEIGVPYLKIASGDLTFLPLLAYADTLDIPVILSTGGATMIEIADTVWGRLGNQYEAERLGLLHCRSIYPCPRNTMNLRTIEYFRTTYPLCTPGLSDHTLALVTTPVYALCLGARIIEKHIRLEDSLGVDTSHSLYPDSFKHMTQALHNVSAELGKADKTVHPLEGHDRLWARRSPEDWLRPTQAAREGRWA